ncbi:hypothetical protein BROUX41_002575 [Berkeleyomyces rouxiae]|uniref:uncharacterized protein n=1 Tax=Berkeleyomyces rouxiae TaxID=2035830 RepID=UPI003B7CA803
MASASKNPFRRKGLSMPPPTVSTVDLDLRPALASSSVFDPDVEDTASEASNLITSTPPPKVPKKVRLQSPPMSPYGPELASGNASELRSPLESRPVEGLSTESVSTIPDNQADPFNAQVPDDDSNDDDDDDSDGNDDKPTVESTPQIPTVPHNPFNKTLQDMKDLTNEARSSSKDTRSHGARASLDVQAFQRLLLTGSTGLEPKAPLQTQAKSPVSESASRVPNADSTSPPPPPPPTNFHKKPPPPPSSRHGRSIKSVDLSQNLSPLSPQRPTPTSTLVSPTHPALATSPIRLDAGNRVPAPPPPPRRTLQKLIAVSPRIDEVPTSIQATATLPGAAAAPHVPSTVSTSPDEPESSNPSKVIGSPKSAKSPTPGSHPVKLKPQPPPTRNPSLRRPKGPARTASNASNSEPSRKPLTTSNRGSAPPPPPTPRQRGWSKGSADGPGTPKKSPDRNRVDPASQSNLLEEINALQREVEAAMKGGTA